MGNASGWGPPRSPAHAAALAAAHDRVQHHLAGGPQHRAPPPPPHDKQLTAAQMQGQLPAATPPPIVGPSRPPPPGMQNSGREEDRVQAHNSGRARSEAVPHVRQIQPEDVFGIMQVVGEVLQRAEPGPGTAQPGSSPRDTAAHGGGLSEARGRLTVASGSAEPRGGRGQDGGTPGAGAANVRATHAGADVKAGLDSGGLKENGGAAAGEMPAGGRQQARVQEPSRTVRRRAREAARAGEPGELDPGGPGGTILRKDAQDHAAGGGEKAKVKKKKPARTGNMNKGPKGGTRGCEQV